MLISDGAPGLYAALDQVCPHRSRERCKVHKARNVLATAPETDQGRVKVDFWEIFSIPEEIAPGAATIAEARRRGEHFAETWGGAYPRAMACVLDGSHLLVAHLAFPRAHWSRIRHTNLIERTFGETCRRVKVFGRLPGESPCLSLLWAVLDRATAGWRGITYTPADVRLLQGLQH